MSYHVVFPHHMLQDATSFSEVSFSEVFGAPDIFET